MRSTAGAQAARRDRKRRGCRPSLGESGSAVGVSLGGSLLQRRVVGSPVCYKASGGRFGIGVLLVG